MVCIAKYDKWINEDGIACITAWSRNGLTKADVANNMGITRSTLHEWEKKFPDISNALTRGRDEADCIVENALFKKTQGYNVKVRKTFKIKVVDYDPETGKKVREREELEVGYDEVHVPADEKAQEFWLCNRNSKQWKRNGEKNEKTENTENSGVIIMPEVMQGA